MNRDVSSRIWIPDLDPGSGSRIRILIFYPSRSPGAKSHRIPDPDPQHWFSVEFFKLPVFQIWQMKGQCKREKTNTKTDLWIREIRSVRTGDGSRFLDPDYGKRANASKKCREDEKGRQIWAVSNLRNCNLLVYVRVPFQGSEALHTLWYVQMSKFDTIFFQWNNRVLDH